jgi:hypothetical protein
MYICVKESPVALTPEKIALRRKSQSGKPLSISGLVAGVFYLQVIRAGDQETLAVIFPGRLESGLCPETKISVSVKDLLAMLMVNLVLVTALYLILVLAWDGILH